MEHALTQYRSARKLTLEDFGQLVGASKSQVWKWERGSVPRPSAMTKIVGVTKSAVTPNDWLRLVEESQ